MLGSPIGSREFVAAVLAAKRDKHEELLARLPALEDLQSAWLLLLLCAAPRCNYLLRTVPPSLTDEFAAAHDAAISRCLAVLLAGGDQPIDIPPFGELRAQLPLRMGALGLSSAREHRHAAYWASWADVIGALRECHPGTSRDPSWICPPLTRRPAREGPSTPLSPSASRTSKLQHGRPSRTGLRPVLSQAMMTRP